MARALQDIITELDTVYRPQRDLYNKQLTEVDPQLDAEKKGLMAQKDDSFRQISDQANRRGMFYSGMPIQEEQRYTGQQFLPALANLQGKYATQRFGLQETLAKLVSEQHSKAYGIREGELAQEEEQRQFNERLRAQQEADAASRAAGSGGGGGGYNFTGGNTLGAQTPAKTYLGNDDFRGRLAYLAQGGNGDARVALKYTGNNGRYDGAVSSVDEYAALKRAGITGNYYVPGLGSATGNNTGVGGLSGYTNLSNVRFN